MYNCVVQHEGYVHKAPISAASQMSVRAVAHCMGSIVSLGCSVGIFNSVLIVASSVI